MPEYFTTEDFVKPIECLTMALENIQDLYDEERIEDRENAEQLIESYKQAIEALKKELVEEFNNYQNSSFVTDKKSQEVLND